MHFLFLPQSGESSCLPGSEFSKNNTFFLGHLCRNLLVINEVDSAIVCFLANSSERASNGPFDNLSRWGSVKKFFLQEFSILLA